MNTSLALLALAIGAFGIGTTEFIVAGLLPEVSAGLDVGIPAAGLLVTGYAIGVAVGGPILAILTNGLARKPALLVLTGIFVVGHVLCAVAPDYGFLMAARIVASFCHGAFFGIASVVAVSIVPDERKATAVALVWMGLTAATIVGVPAGTALGHAFGWRSTFWAVAAVGAVSMAAMAAWLPGTIGGGTQASLAREFRTLTQPQVLLTLAISATLCAATFSVFTYIAPFTTEVAGLSPEVLPVVLLVFGVGGAIGMLVGARLADWRLMPSLIGMLGALVAIYLLLLAVGAGGPWLMYPLIFAWGFCFYAPAAPIQIRVVTVAGDAPNLASTLNQSAFNVGNAIGPSIGAAALTLGFAYATLPWIGAIVMLAGLFVAVVSYRLERTRPAVEAA